MKHQYCASWGQATLPDLARAATVYMLLIAYRLSLLFSSQPA